jgi:SAM-dependent methyltransferase
MLEYVNCNLCGSNDITQLYQIDKVRVVQCNHCDLVYTNPRLSEEERLKIYNTKEYFSDYLNDLPFTLAIGHSRLNAILKYKKPPGKILEIGCGTGHFLDLARQKGWEAYGVEISAFIGRFAREKLGLEVFVGPIEKASLAPESFDIICLYHLLEHISSPKEYCQKLYSLLKPKGLLVIEVPIISVMHNNKLKGNGYELHPYEHLFHFSRETLSTLLTQSGYKIINIFFGGGTGLMGRGQSSIKNMPRKLFIKYFDYFDFFRKTVNFIRVRLFRHYNSMITIYALRK